MFKAKNILFLLIGGIILLHSVISHRHIHYAGSGCELRVPQKSITLFDGIRFTLAVDHGEGHLEHFLNSSLDIPVVSLTAILTHNFVYLPAARHFILKESVQPGLNLPPDPLRGPPARS